MLILLKLLSIPNVIIYLWPVFTLKVEKLSSLYSVNVKYYSKPKNLWYTFSILHTDINFWYFLIKKIVIKITKTQKSA